MGLFDWVGNLFGKGKLSRAKTVSELARDSGINLNPSKSKAGDQGIDLEQLDREKKKPEPEARSENPQIVDYLVHGKWLNVISSNVHKVKYDREEKTLYIGYLNRSVYWYSPISTAQAQDILLTPSKGGWVWDHLRIRGTARGYKVPYGRVS